MCVCRIWHESERASLQSSLHPKKGVAQRGRLRSSSGDFLAHKICRSSEVPSQDTQGGTLTACLVLCLCLCPQVPGSNLRRTGKATEVRL